MPSNVSFKRGQRAHRNRRRQRRTQTARAERPGDSDWKATKVAAKDELRKGAMIRALLVPNFRIYFAGEMVSVSGAWMQTTAQAWLVLELTNSPLALATVAALQFLPITLLSLFGGAISDRFSRQKLLFFTQLLGALQAVLLGTLVVTGTVEIWHVYVLAFTLGVINALAMPMRLAFVSDFVPAGLLPVAVAMTAMAQNFGRIFGPALGGLAIAAFGVGSAFFINAVSFSGILLALLVIRGTARPANRAATTRGMIGEIGESLAFARRRPSILFLLIGAAFIGLFGQNFTTMIPLIAVYLLDVTPAKFGLLNSCLGAGSVLGALILTAQGAPSVRRLLAAGCTFGLALVAISTSSVLWLSGALFFLLGGAYVTYTTSVNTSMQLQSPPEMRGRIAAMTSFVSVGCSPFGQVLTGAVANGASVWVAILINGLMCCVGMALAYAYLRFSHHSSASMNLELVEQPIAPAVVAAVLGPATGRDGKSGAVE
jgi:MFS family permease